MTEDLTAFESWQEDFLFFRGMMGMRSTKTVKKWKANDDETDPAKRNRGADFGIPDGRGTSGERTVSDGKA